MFYLSFGIVTVLFKMSNFSKPGVNTTCPYSTTTNNQSCIGWKHPATTYGDFFGTKHTTFKNVVRLVLVGKKSYNFVSEIDFFEI